VVPNRWWPLIASSAARMRKALTTRKAKNACGVRSGPTVIDGAARSSSETSRGKRFHPHAKAFLTLVSITVNARGRTMGFSCRTFLVARDDTLWRLSNAKFDRMLRDPASHCLPVFAGQRARMASVVVELVARNPVRVVLNTFSILTFDAEGRIDLGRFEKQQFSLVELAVAPVFAVFNVDGNQTVVDATSRFIAQGGQWVPSRALASVIDQTALGQRQCRQL